MAVTQTQSWQEAFFWGKGIEHWPKPCPFRALFVPVSCPDRAAVAGWGACRGGLTGRACAQWGRWQLRTGKKAIAPWSYPLFKVARTTSRATIILRSVDEFVR